MNKKLNPLNTLDYAWGGALSGGLSQGASMAMTGAKLGSIVPGVGNIAGAAIGGAAGLIVGGITGSRQEDAANKLQEEEELAQQKLIQSNYDAGLGKKRVAAYNESVNSPMNPLEQGYAMGGMMGDMPMAGPINNNDVNHYGEGGTHEQNPYGGIPQGMGNNGKMNTVEEGEVSVKLNPDTKYIFSDRLIFE